MDVDSEQQEYVIRCASCNQPGHFRSTIRLCRYYVETSPSLLNIAKQTDHLPERHYLGSMSELCPFCDAKFWVQERTVGGVSNPRFQMCCGVGRYKLMPLDPTPALIADLLKEGGNEFKTHILSYNNALGFASIGVNLDQSVSNSRGGAFAYRIHGRLYHRIGSLFPPENSAFAFAQIYIFDNETTNRRSHVLNLNTQILEQLQTLLHDISPIVHDFKTMAQYVRENPDQIENVSMVFQSEGVPDQRRYNAPTNSTEIGILILNNTNNNAESNKPSYRDVVIRPQNGGNLMRINELNQMYDPFSYVLLFPTGQPGWSINTRSTIGLKVTAMQYYSFRLMYRNNDHCLHLFGKLFHQFIVDMYAKIEQGRLNFIRHNQARLRTELYKGLQDAANHNDTDTTSLGRKIILPSTFIGGPRHMAQLYQDAISIVRRFGKPDYFITFTCNPKWPEITGELLFGQSANDRPDLCARIFKLKLKQFIDDITRDHILGKVVAHVRTIEFQKRGLPHAHMLFIVSPEDKPRNPDDYNRVVSAEIPDPVLFPLAYATVTRNMMHGPCGAGFSSAVCMKDGKCSKNYPKGFAQETTTMGNGYPNYRRRQDDRQYQTRSGFSLDNRWVVPHNVYLCTKYDAHVNVEVCTTVSAVKYIYKYVYKGHDRAKVQISGNSSNQAVGEQEAGLEDEIDLFIDARYVSAPEAIWRIFGFSLHKEYPAHQRLSIHLPGENSVVYPEGADIDEVMANALAKNTTLEAWFQINRTDANANQYLYMEFPEYYTWHKKDTVWSPRRRGLHETIGRMYSVSPRNPEKFYLRLLLIHVRGATSFEDVRTVEGVIFDTFQAAARALGLLENDDQWDDCLMEGNSFQSSLILRRLFATILIYCQPSSPFRLWNNHKENLAEDYLRRVASNSQTALTDEAREAAFGNCLLDIHDLLMDQNLEITKFEGFALPTTDTRHPENEELRYQGMGRLEREQRELCFEAAQSIADPSELAFNADQRAVFDALTQAVGRQTEIDGAFVHMNSNLFFLDGPGGTGKTFLFNAILQHVRKSDHIALSVAISGTAATLLKGGRTAHSRFHIPLDCHENSTCCFDRRHESAKLIAKSSIIVWDEASMVSRHLLETVDRSLRDIMKSKNPALSNVPFGGKLIVFGGDFRQVLPVVPKAGKQEIINACITSSNLWRHIQQLRLTLNMRVQQAQSEENTEFANTLQQFSQFLLSIGDGSYPTQPGIIPNGVRLPSSMILPTSGLESICHAVYNNFQDPADIRAEVVVAKAILTPTNAYVNEVNAHVLDMFPGDYVQFLSVDTALSEDDALELPVEFLNSLECGSLPPHDLKLKVGSAIMMLRNLNPAQGLCNGTRLICKGFLRQLVQAEIATGPFRGNIALIPRIALIAEADQVGVDFKRLQFPVRPAFAMTINKSQGQTLDSVGLYLPAPVFSHGQLYVALSRVETPQSIKISLASEDNSQNLIANVVYQEVLRHH